MFSLQLQLHLLTLKYEGIEIKFAYEGGSIRSQGLYVCVMMELRSEDLFLWAEFKKKYYEGISLNNVHF